MCSRFVERFVPEDHHDRNTDGTAVVHLRWSEGLLPSATTSPARDARISEEEVGSTESLMNKELYDVDRVPA